MECTTCGTQLLPGTRVCSRCGTDMSYTVDAHEVAHIEYGSSAQETPSMPPTSQTKGLAQNDYGIPASPPSQQPALTPVQSPTSQAPSSRRFSVATVILLIILLLLLASGSSGLIYYATVLHPGELRVQATSVAKTVFITQAQSTVRAKATTAALTPEQVYRQVTSGTPVINDPLTSRDNSIWLHGNGPDNSCDFVGGAFHLKASTKGIATTCFAYNSVFGNLAFQVQMTLIKAGSGGLIFHASGGSSAYLFFINQSGVYSFFLTGTSGVLSLASGNSSAIHGGLNQPNVLTAVASDGQIYLYINKQAVTHITDTTYSSGQIGLAVDNPTSLSDAAFNNAQVWSI